MDKIKVDYLTQVFNIFESGVRLLFRKAIEGTFTNSQGGAVTRGYFSSLINSLEIINILNTDDKDFLLFMYEIRNTLHNNGIYIAERKNGVLELEKPMNYYGTTHTFYDGKSLDWLDYDLILDLNLNLVKVVYKIFTNDIVRGLPTMYDPTALESYADNLTKPYNDLIADYENEHSNNFGMWYDFLEKQLKVETVFQPDSDFFKALESTKSNQANAYKESLKVGDRERSHNLNKDFSLKLIKDLEIGINLYRGLIT